MAVASRPQRPAGSAPLRDFRVRMTPEDYDRLSAMAANEGVAVAVMARELMLKAMDPQIFGERYHDVEDLLRSVVKKEMETHSERLHKRLYRIGGITAAIVLLRPMVLGRQFGIEQPQLMAWWREAEVTASVHGSERT